MKETADLLGVTETEPIDFFIYGDEAAFRTALGPGTRENVGGQAHADIRTLFALIEPSAIDDTWVRVVVPHELTHLVFDTAVDNPYRFPPRWVNEGLAVYLSEGYGPATATCVADAVDRRELLPLTALAGQFPTDPDKTYLAYAEAVSAIDHLVRTDGEPALYDLVDAYADGPDRRRGVHQGASAGTSRRSRRAGSRTWAPRRPRSSGRVANPPGPLPAGLGRAGRRGPPRRRHPPRTERAPGRPGRRRRRPRRPAGAPGPAPSPRSSSALGAVVVVVIVGHGRREAANRRAVSADRRPGPGDPDLAGDPRRWRSSALGFLIAAQLASEGPRIRYTSQERTPLVETALDLQAQQDGLKQQILELRSDIEDLEATGEGGATVTQDLNRQLEEARIAAGLVAMTGPGLVIQLSDSSAPAPPDGNDRDYLVSGQDVLAVVEELWLAGAEGVAVNGERVTNATAIVDIGGSCWSTRPISRRRTR